MEAHDQLNYITNGMDVFDVNGKRVGTVQHIYSGNDMVLTNNPDMQTVRAELQEALGGEKDFPTPVYSRLYRYGFLHVRRGLFLPDVFIVPQQIDDVEEASLYLNVPIDELLKE